MFGLGITELSILVGILVLIFGPKQIPRLAQSIGEAIKYVRKGFSGKNKDN